LAKARTGILPSSFTHSWTLRCHGGEELFLGA
jgi:hypothetical protein